jgi:hypothetical protein
MSLFFNLVKFSFSRPRPPFHTVQYTYVSLSYVQYFRPKFVSLRPENNSSLMYDIDLFLTEEIFETR